MPYIKPERRAKIDPSIDELVKHMIGAETSKVNCGENGLRSVVEWKVEPTCTAWIGQQVDQLTGVLNKMNWDDARKQNECKDINAGDLNYTITRICMGMLKGRFNYDNVNTVVGVITRVQQSLFSVETPENNVVLNYVLIKIVKNIRFTSYSCFYNTVIGVLECVKMELYRRVASPYEDLKVLENGDVTEYEATNKEIRNKLVDFSKQFIAKCAENVNKTIEESPAYKFLAKLMDEMKEK